MLQMYADIDDRVRTLGYIMKVFAKVVAGLHCLMWLVPFSHTS